LTHHREDAALQVSGCRLLAGTGEYGLLVCRWVLVKDPCHQGKELWQQASRLCSIRGGEKEVDWILSETWIQKEPEPPGILKEGQAESMLIGLENHRAVWVGRDLQSSPCPTPPQ